MPQRTFAACPVMATGCLAQADAWLDTVRQFADTEAMHPGIRDLGLRCFLQIGRAAEVAAPAFYGAQAKHLRGIGMTLMQELASEEAHHAPEMERLCQRFGIEKGASSWYATGGRWAGELTGSLGAGVVRNLDLAFEKIAVGIYLKTEGLMAPVDAAPMRRLRHQEELHVQRLRAWEP